MLKFDRCFLPFRRNLGVNGIRKSDMESLEVSDQRFIGLINYLAYPITHILISLPYPLLL